MLVLASTSARRQQILAAAGIPFETRAPNIPEQRAPEESPDAYVRRLAEQKAFAVPMNPGETILAGDTVVVVDQHILEKPADPPPMPGKPDSSLASMGIYVFNTEFLFDKLRRRCRSEFEPRLRLRH